MVYCIIIFRDFPGDPVVKTLCPLQGARVQSLVGELGSCMLCDAAKKKNKNKLSGPGDFFFQELLNY